MNVSNEILFQKRCHLYGFTQHDVVEISITGEKLRCEKFFNVSILHKYGKGDMNSCDEINISDIEEIQRNDKRGNLIVAGLIILVTFLRIVVAILDIYDELTLFNSINIVSWIFYWIIPIIIIDMLILLFCKSTELSIKIKGKPYPLKFSISGIRMKKEYHTILNCLKRD